jgi:hypothetical protein
MAKKIQEISNYIVVTDTVTNHTDEYPKNRIRYRDNGNEIELIDIADHTQNRIYQFSELVDSADAPWASLAVLLTWLRTNTGNFNTPNLFTGWASYMDTQYAVGSPFTLLANADTDFPNNAGAIIDDQKPTDIASFYTNGKITGRVGDSIDFMNYFRCIPTNNQQNLDIWLDLGGAFTDLYRQTFFFPKGSGVEHGVMYTIPAGFNGTTWAANGAKIRFRSTHNLSVYQINLNVERGHKAR